MALVSKDRLEALTKSTTFNGIDYVAVDVSQTRLDVFFLNATALAGTVTAAAITGGETIATVAVLPIDDANDWQTSEGRPKLTLHVTAPGDFSNYTLTLTSSKLDRFFDHVPFSFKANCPTDLDCASPCTPCPPLTGDLPPIDYLAKDFLSFRKALSDFSALRYPDWHERSEADFGMMFMEALCGLADNLSYMQDRVGWEAYLETATQRRSLVRLARLVDYEPRPATCAGVLLQFDVTGGPLPAGIPVSALGPDGVAIYFETGTGLLDKSSYPANPAWNRIGPNSQRGSLIPYFWDAGQECLTAGSTEAWIIGHGLGLYPGQALLIDTLASVPANPPIRELIHLISADEMQDPLFQDPTTNQPYQVTHVTWSEPLKRDHDLTFLDPKTPRTIFVGNLVPATQARRYTETFAIDTPPAGVPHMTLALARLGANHSLTPPAYQYVDGNFVIGSCTNKLASPPAWQYLYPLNHAPLAWLSQPDPNAPPTPEIDVVQADTLHSTPWGFQPEMLDARPFDAVYTVDPISYVAVGTSSIDGRPLLDYDGDQGATIRFGDGVFGQSPNSGATFRVRYRVGGGTAGNVAADSITGFTQGMAPITAVTNPFAASGGQDAESNQTIQRLAPQQFRAVQYRAVRPEDYEKAAMTLPWVLRAGTVFRWTGSWLTVFTTPDPQGTEALPVEEHTQLIDLLNRYRMTGYESYAPAPVTVSVDLQITVCALSSAFRGEVEADVLRKLSTQRFPDGRSGFFYFDNFTFGTPLERSALEAQIQNAYGVAGIISILYRRRGYNSDWENLPDTITIAPNQILRVDNDPGRPNYGSIRVYMEGGK